MPPHPQPAGENGSTAAQEQSRPPLAFIMLVFALSIPFWVVGALNRFQLLEGLPVSALASFCPLIAASVLIRREQGAAGVREVLKRVLDHERIKDKIWVRAHPTPDAERDGPHRRPNSLETTSASTPAFPGPGRTGHVHCLLHRRGG